MNLLYLIFTDKVVKKQGARQAQYQSKQLPSNFVTKGQFLLPK